MILLSVAIHRSHLSRIIVVTAEVNLKLTYLEIRIDRAMYRWLRAHEDRTSTKTKLTTSGLVFITLPLYGVGIFVSITAALNIIKIGATDDTQSLVVVKAS